MRLPRTLIPLPALLLVALGGCATSSPQGDPSSEGQESSTSGGSGAPSSAPSSSSPQSSGTPASSSSGSSTVSSGSAGSAQTPDERRAAIDRRLNDSLGTFDEALRKEQERVAQERDAREAAEAGTAQTESDSTQESGEGEPGTAGTEAPPPSGTDGKAADGSARPGDLKSDKDRVADRGAASGSGASVGEIPDGSDDDIVARRLRKAAEQETDPELKEKLWKEYIEYKKNTGK